MVLIQSNSTVLNIGAVMPPFELPATDGSVVRSGDVGAPVLVVVFTCNHCPYAQAYEDRLIALAREFAAKGARFVLINSNDPAEYPEDSLEHMRERAKQKSYPFPYCVDASQDVAKAFGALCTPHCFVFDGDRTLRYKGRIDDSWKDPSKVAKRELHDAIAALLEGRDPPVPEANAIGCSIKWKKGNEPSVAMG